MLDGLDALVIDLQDIGARFYTYMTTMAYVHGGGGEAQDHGRRARPAESRSTACRSKGRRSTRRRSAFTGYFPMPIRHGMTIGELARLFNGENKIGADLTVVPMKNWRRDEWFDETGLPWVNPSPNMRNMNEATLYPGIGAIEGTNISVGRGTDTPFEQVGAPWIDGVALGGRAQRARDPRRPLLPGALHAGVEQVRQRGVPRRVHDRDRSARAAAGARRRRDRRELQKLYADEVRARLGRTAVRTAEGIARLLAGERSRRRREQLGRRGGAVAVDEE